MARQRHADQRTESTVVGRRWKPGRASARRASDGVADLDGITTFTISTRRIMIRSTHSTHVLASIETVWGLITDVEAWTAWQPDVTAARADGPLEVGSSFTWSSGGLDIASTVTALDAPRSITWHGPANGIDGVHRWELAPEGDGVRVTTDETWAGAPVDEDPKRAAGILDASLVRWLRILRAEAEARDAAEARGPSLAAPARRGTPSSEEAERASRHR